MTATTKKQKANDQYASQQRCYFRKHLRGLPSQWMPGDELLWKRDPKDWAWLNEPTRSFLTLDQLSKELMEAGINKVVDFMRERLLHEDWPSTPNEFYKDWVSWYHVFGRVLLTLDQLRDACEEKGVTRIREYAVSYKLHDTWPCNPDKFYRDEWASWVDLFGKKHLTLDQLKKEVKKAGVDTEHGYRSIHSRLHKTWPSNPSTYYKEWVGWPDLFSREARRPGRPTGNFLKYKELRRAVRKAKITTGNQYREMQRKFPEWPFNPMVAYREEWVSWWNFLGKKKKRPNLSFREKK